MISGPATRRWADFRDYEFDELKIDRSFVGDLDSGDPTLVATQIALAHGLGLGVVAEGVETEAQLEYLRNAGCEQVQGYLIARPLPPPEIRALLAGPGEWRPHIRDDQTERREPRPGQRPRASVDHSHPTPSSLPSNLLRHPGSPG